jgi:hypothetical protein
VEGIRLFTAGEEQWFSENACTGNLTSNLTIPSNSPPVCLLGGGWATATFNVSQGFEIPNSGWQAWASVGSESATNGHLVGKAWDGSNWQTNWDSQVSPGKWQSFTSVGNSPQGQVTIDGITPNADDAMLAVRLLPYANGGGLRCPNWTGHRHDCLICAYSIDCSDNKPDPVGCKWVC